MTTSPSTTVAEGGVTSGVVLPSERQTQSQTMAQRIVGMEHQFKLAAPRGVEARQLVRDAMVALSKTPKLADCTPNSVLGGLMTMAQLGLRVGVLGHGWLIPFWNKNAKWRDPATGRDRYGAFEAQLVIGYQGLVALAYRSQQISRISARIVHANDQFDLEYGLDEKLVHRPATGDRGEVTGYYATVRLTTGAATFYYLTKAEAEAYRDRYAMAKNKEGKVVGPWVTEFDGMALKTCIRQLSKLMPKGTDLAIALDVDDTVRIDISPDSDPAHVSQHLEHEAVESTPHVDVTGEGGDPEGQA